MSEKRRYRRMAMRMSVEVTTPEGETRMLHTRDLSEGGLFLEGCDAEDLPLGQDLMLKVSVALQGDEAPIVKARVVRETEEGLGVCFLQDKPDDAGPDSP